MNKISFTNSNQVFNSNSLVNASSTPLNVAEYIKGVFSRIFGTGNSSIPKSYAFQYIRIQKLVHALLKECGIKKDIGVSVAYSSYTPASAMPTRIKLNPLFLLDWDSLPSRLKISGISDAKLQSREFYNDFFKNLSKIFLDIPETPSLEDIFILLLFIQLKSDTKKSFAAINCMIAHELGHIHHEHSHSLHERVHSVYKKFPILIKFVSPFTLAGIFHFLLSRSHEAQADHFAAKHLENAGEGAEYGFQCARQAIQILKHCDALSTKERLLTHFLMPFNEGHIIQLLTHGSLSGRARYIRAINQKAFPKKPAE